MTFTGLARGFQPQANYVLITTILDFLSVQMLVSIREKIECSTCTLSTLICSLYLDR